MRCSREVHRTWNRPEAAELAKLYALVAPNYAAVAESYQKAQEAAKQTEEVSEDLRPTRIPRARRSAPGWRCAAGRPAAHGAGADERRRR